MQRRLLWALAPAALALSTLASAQPPGPPPGGGPVVRMMHGGPDGAEMKALHEQMMKQHLDDLTTVLRLRPDQEAALQAFVAAHHGPDGMQRFEMRHEGPAGPPKAMATPERLAEEARHEQAMAAEHEKARAALARFYAALSPDQQKVFDALQRLGGGGHMGGMDGHRMIMLGGPGGMMGGPGMRRIEIRRTDKAPTPGHEPD